jgi:phosphatidylglycerol---prolipoprotein diacylglyceryl transferase
VSFPVYLHLGQRVIHPHVFFEALSYLAAFAVYFLLRRRFGDPIFTPIRFAALAAAVAGAVLGAKILFWLEDPQLTLQHLHDSAYFVGGKTIVGALTGGLVSVELFKRYVGLRASTGDLYAIPLALGIAIGRIGCFLTGLADNTYGTPTHLPWAVDFGDGVPRHPTQIYEIIFLLLLIPALWHVLKKIARAEKLVVFLPGDAFKLFMVAYMTFRLLCDFIKPYQRLFLGLGGIQWCCVLVLLHYSRDVIRWLRPHASPARN